MGSIHYLTRYIPNLAQAAAALWLLLKNTEKNIPINWLPEHNLAFKNILQLVPKITQNKYSDHHLDTRIVCDASNTGLRAALEQHSAEGWVAIAYASRFLNSIWAIEHLGAVWAIEHYK